VTVVNNNNNYSNIVRSVLKCVRPPIELFIDFWAISRSTKNFLIRDSFLFPSRGIFYQNIKQKKNYLGTWINSVMLIKNEEDINECASEFTRIDNNKVLLRHKMDVTHNNSGINIVKILAIQIYINALAMRNETEL